MSAVAPLKMLIFLVIIFTGFNEGTKFLHTGANGVCWPGGRRADTMEGQGLVRLVQELTDCHFLVFLAFALPYTIFILVIEAARPCKC